MTATADPQPARPAPPGRARRALAGAAAALGLAGVFLIAAAGAIALHLDTAAARRVARGLTNDLLGSFFQGKIISDEIDELSLTSVRIRAAVAVDPRDGQVIRASGIEARADVLGMLHDGLFGEGELRIEIPYIRIEHADVLVEASPTGGVTIGDTFTLRPSKPSSKPPSKPKAPPRPVRVALSRIEIGRGWVHGLVAPPRALDADVSRLVGSVHVGPEGVAVDVDQTGLVDRAFLPARAAGSANYHLRAGQRTLMWTSFAGEIGAAGVTARGVMDGGHITASASLPRATPAELATLIPGHPIAEPVSVRIELDGDAPTFDVSGAIAALPAGAARDAVAAGSVAFEGRLDAAGPVRFEADVSAREVDPRVVGVALPGLEAEGSAARAGAPIASPRGQGGAAPTITAEGRIRAELGGAPRLIVDARTEPTALLGEPVPAADVHLVYDRGELSGTTSLHEPGMPVEGAFALLPGGAVRFVARGEVPSIAGAPRLAARIHKGGTRVDGRARVRVEGTVRRGELDARIGGAVAGLKVGGAAALGGGRIEGRLSGPLGALQVDARLEGQDMTAGGYSFEAVRAEAKGELAAPSIRAKLSDGDDSVDASARLSAAKGELQGVELTVRREGQALSGTIARVSPARGGVAIEGLRISGRDVGALEGTLEVSGDDVSGSLRGEGVNLDKVAQMLGLPHRVRGIANVDVAIERGKRGRTGRVLLELEEGELSLLTGVSAHLAATIQDDHLQADGLVRLVAKPDSALSGPADRCEGTIASVRVSRGEGTLSGPLLRAATWTSLTGSAEVAAEDWDLGCLARLSPAISVFLSDVRGKLTTRFGVARAPGERFPSVRGLVARTRGLTLAGPQGLGDEHPAWESRSIDAQLKGSLDGATGKAEATLTLFDGELLGDLSASIDLDLITLADHPERRWESLRASRIAGHLAIPRRAVSSLRTLPTFAHRFLPPIAGEVRIDAYGDGTLAAPFLAIRARGFGVTYVGGHDPAALAFPADIDALVTYDSERATLDAHVSKGSREIATVTAEASAALGVLLGDAPPPGKPRWSGGFHARLTEVPLGELPLLEESGVAGHVTGVVAMSGLGVAPTLTAALDLPDLKIGDDLFFERGGLSVRIEPQRQGDASADTALARVRLEAQDGGVLEATAYAGVRWRDGLVPEIDGGRTADLSAFAQRFRLAALQPLTAGALSKLDGYLDGRLRIGWLRAGEGAAGEVNADMSITGGLVHIPELGQELRDATARITAEQGVVRFDDISAAGVSGRLRGWALARLDGLALLDGAGELSIKKGEEVPLTLEGVPLGSAWGDVAFTAEKREGELSFLIKVPTLHVKLPATSARNVQPLDDNPDVGVSHPLGPPAERRAPDALRYALTFELGEVEVEGSGLKLHVTSSADAPPRVVLTDEARVSGDLLLARGEIEVFGKSFEIERGLIRLRREEASNPYLNATAHWDAPDGTRIFVDYVGLLKPITDEKLRFRANPPLSQKDILARLLLDADAAQGGAGSSADATARQAAGGVAVGVGGELASAQFNAILNGITPLRGLSTRFGTTSEGALRTSIVYELDDDLTALASYEGAPATGATASTTTSPSGTAGGAAGASRSGRTELSVDWRFHRNWSLRGTVGVGGAQTSSGILDLLWQYRY